MVKDVTIGRGTGLLNKKAEIQEMMLFPPHIYMLRKDSPTEFLSTV